MSLPRYPEYKDSGVAWLGEVPGHWEISPLKYAVDVRLSNIDKHTVEDEPSVLLCNYTDVYKNEHIDSSIEFMAATASPEQIRRLSLEVDDVIITKDSEDPRDIGIPAHVAEVLPNLVCGYHLALLRPRAGINGGYLYHLFKSRYVEVAFEIEATGMTRYALGKYSIENLGIPLPSLVEQSSIASFLDRETGKIDALVTEQEKLIQLLREKRQADISHAVTKGLNPNAKLKDSGIEWLGDVPEHWKVCAIKHIVSTPITDGPHETPNFPDEGVPFVSAEAVSSGKINFEKIRGYISEEDHLRYSEKYRPQVGDIYMVKSGATTGVTAIVETDIDFNIWSPLAVIRCRQESLPYFVLNFMRSKNFQEAVTLNWSFGTQQNIGMGVIENLSVTVPPIEEQTAIATFLNIETTKLDALTAEAQRGIALLKERRSALISAAVSGKIDVRHSAPEMEAA